MSIGSILASPVAKVAAITTLGIGGLLVARELTESSKKSLSGAIIDAKIGAEHRHPTPHGESGLSDALRGLGLSQGNSQVVSTSSQKHGLNESTVEDYFHAQISGFGNSEQVATDGFIDLIGEKPGMKTFKQEGSMHIDWVNVADSEKTSDKERHIYRLSEIGLSRADAAETAHKSAKLNLNTETVSDFFDAQINGFENSAGEAIKGFTKLTDGKAGLATFRDESPGHIDWVDVSP
jgi:hypothetical protein